MPVLEQYEAVKREHPDAIVLFRLGDFYETFGDDAERAAPLLGITLTSRELGKGHRVAMAGGAHLPGRRLGFERGLLDEI